MQYQYFINDMRPSELISTSSTSCFLNTDFVFLLLEKVRGLYMIHICELSPVFLACFWNSVHNLGTSCHASPRAKMKLLRKNSAGHGSFCPGSVNLSWVDWRRWGLGFSSSWAIIV